MEPGLGDYFVTRTTPAGCGLTGYMFAAAIQWATASDYNHAGIYVGNGQIVEATPSGARITDVSNYQNGHTLWSQGLHLTSAAQRERVALEARNLVGTKYGYLDIIALALAQKRLGGHVNALRGMDQQPWWVRRMARTDRLVCSELVDYAYYLAGVHLFDDGRPFQLVAPSDLAQLITDV
jgi:hypothetical protein